MRTINLSGRQVLPPGTFLMYPEHDTLLRENLRSLSPSYSRLLYIRAILIVAWLIVLVFCVYDMNRWVQLTYRGEETQGLVYLKFVCCGQTMSHNLVYEYKMPLRGDVVRIRSISGVPVEFYNQVEIGTQISVRYLPELPDSAALAWELATPYTKLLFLALSVLSVTVLSAKTLAQARSLRQLQHEGWVVPGQLVSSAVEPTALGPRLHVVYEFMTPDNQMLRGEDAGIRGDLSDAPPAPGTSVGVIYLSPDSYRLL